MLTISSRKIKTASQKLTILIPKMLKKGEKDAMFTLTISEWTFYITT